MWLEGYFPCMIDDLIDVLKEMVVDFSTANKMQKDLHVNSRVLAKKVDHICVKSIEKNLDHEKNSGNIKCLIKNRV